MQGPGNATANLRLITGLKYGVFLDQVDSITNSKFSRDYRITPHRDSVDTNDP